MEFLNTIQTIAAFNFLLIGILILVNQKVVTYGVKLLGFFLIAKGVTLFTNLTYALNWPINESLVLLLSSALFLYTPFLYFFARYLVTKSLVNLKVDWPHFILFGAFFLFNLVLVISPFQSVTADYGITALYYTQSISYTVFAFMLIKQKGEDTKIQNWLKNLLLAFLVVWFAFLFEIVFALMGNMDYALISKFIGVASILILANLTLVIAIYSPELFFKGLRVIKKSNIEKTVVTEDNYNRILDLMAQQELYTNAHLKLVDISNAVGLSERNTSLIIKTFHKGNFYDFLNAFRIEEAKKLLIENQESLTISEILYDVGFNSKSVFNTLFKKKVGMTPTEFRKTKAKLYSTG